MARSEADLHRLTKDELVRELVKVDASTAALAGVVTALEEVVVRDYMGRPKSLAGVSLVIRQALLRFGLTPMSLLEDEDG